MGVGSPVNAGSGVKVISLLASTVQVPSPGTVTVATGFPVTGSISSTAVISVGSVTPSLISLAKISTVTAVSYTHLTLPTICSV